MSEIDATVDNALNQACLTNFGITKNHDIILKVFIKLVVHRSLVFVFLNADPVLFGFILVLSLLRNDSCGRIKFGGFTQSIAAAHFKKVIFELKCFSRHHVRLLSWGLAEKGSSSLF